MDSKFKYALSEFSRLSNESKPKHRYKFIRPMRTSGFTKDECNKLGFLCGDTLWESCLSNNERNSG